MKCHGLKQPFLFSADLQFGLVKFGYLGPVGFSDFGSQVVFMKFMAHPGSFQGVGVRGPAFERDAIG